MFNMAGHLLSAFPRTRSALCHLLVRLGHTLSNVPLQSDSVPMQTSVVGKLTVPTYLLVRRVILTLITLVIMVITLITFIWIHSVSLPVHLWHCSTHVFCSSSSAGTTMAPPAFSTHPNFPTWQRISSHRSAFRCPSPTV